MADYPITAVDRRTVLSGSAGTGPYAFSFPVLAQTDLAVYKDDTKLTLTTDYTVSIGAAGTGTVTLGVAATGSNNITIVGARAIERTTDFVTAGDLLASSLNTELDSQTIFAQQTSEDADRAIKAPVTDPTSVDMTLPIKTSRATKVLAFDSAGDPVVSTQTLATMEAGSTAAATSAAAAASSATAAASSATGAASSATAAASSATGAASSATGAAASAAAAAAAITGLPDGSAGSPSVAFADDGNTGLFSPAADSIAVTTGGSERMQIDSGGKVGIGTTPASGVQLDVRGTGVLQLVNTDTIQLIASNGGSTLKNVSSNPLIFGTNNTERMQIDSSGNVGIGTSSPNEILTVQRNGTAVAGLSSSTVASFQSTSATAQSSYLSIIAGSSGSTGEAALFFGDADDPDIGKVLYRNSDDSMDFVVNAASRMKIAAGGTTAVTPTSAGATQGFAVYGSGMANGSNMVFISMGTNTGNFISGNNSSGQQFSISHAGHLSKTSGSFKIDHPLPSLNATRSLVHSFIEGPQADLIYRGRADLVAGTVDVNIDTAAGMTDGTFEVLCGDVQCFTSNEDGWTALRGSVTGNVLTITAQDNTCTDTVSWMVIGERCDPHMLETDWTDDDGKVIVEPLKPEILETN